MDPDNEIELDAAPMFRVYKSGRVERLHGTTVVPASVDPATGVSSKDVVIHPATGVFARLYLPSLTAGSPPNKLPILVYYHGGRFIFESASSPTYHCYLNSLVAQAHILAVSVEYRRAPEHLLPAAYDDSWVALQWVASHAAGGPEPWLAEHGDFGRVFLAGDSAGGNIAHHVALRAAGDGGVGIEGLVLVHPFFWGTEPVGTETRDEGTRAFVGRIWRAVIPPEMGGGDVDHPLMNPLAPAAPTLAGLGCRRLLVCVAGRDLLRERGRAYYERLVGSGWGGEAELVESEEEEHVFHLLTPDREKAGALMEKLVSFFKCHYGLFFRACIQKSKI